MSDAAPVPAGYEVLTDAIDLSGVELLNTASAESSNAAARALCAERAGAGVRSDVDAQLLLYVPFLNKCSVHSVLLRVPELGDDDDTQPPSRMKVWPGVHQPLGFEEAEAQRAAFDGAVPGRPGWAVVPLRFVLFQNTTSVQIFLDGDDEDKATVLQSLVLVGKKGDSLDAGRLQDEDPQ